MLWYAFSVTVACCYTSVDARVHPNSVCSVPLIPCIFERHHSQAYGKGAKADSGQQQNMCQRTASQTLSQSWEAMNRNTQRLIQHTLSNMCCISHSPWDARKICSCSAPHVAVLFLKHMQTAANCCRLQLWLLRRLGVQDSTSRT